MSNSSLISLTKISPNKNSPRNHAIDTLTIHCVVGQCSVETLGNVFAPISKEASCNYAIGTDGRIALIVAEKDRSWCSSSGSNDNRAITIECASDDKAPYAVNSKVMAALINLCADICKRNGIKKLVWSTDKNARVNHLNGCNMTVHRDYANKSCPGDYLYNKHGYIAEQVNKKLGSSSGTTTSATGFQKYIIRITSSNGVNIRKGPGTNYATNGAVSKGGAYTIVAESNGTGATKWGKLKSGAGWIALDYTQKIK